MASVETKPGRPAWRMILPLLALLLGACATAPSEEPPREDDTRIAEPEEPPPADEDLIYQVMVAELAGTGGDVEQSLAAWRRAMGLTNDPRVAERATRLALYAEREDVALEAAQRWESLVDSPGQQMHQILGFLYLRDGQTEPARYHLTRVLTGDVQPADDLFDRLESALGTARDRQAALEVVRDLVAEHPQQPGGYRLLARLALEAGEPSLARDAAEDGLALEPGDRDLTLYRAEALLAMGEREAALEGLDELVERHPDDWRLRLDYARRLLDAGAETEALAQFERVHNERPDNADALYAMALLTLEAGYDQEARTYFLSLVDLGERLGAAHYFLGRIAEDGGDMTEALHWYGMVDGEYRVQGALRRAVILGEQGRLARAREAFDDYRARFPEHAIRAYMVEGDMLRRTDRPDAALEVYDEALEEHPEQADLLYSRALLHAGAGDVDRAERDLRRILEQNPDHTHALNALGYTLVDGTDRHEEGMELIRRAYEQEPDDPAILDSMGWGYYRLGDHQRALEYLQRAHDKQPDGEISAHLGEVLWVQDEREQAREVWRDALEREPDHDVLLETIRRLAPEVLDQ